MKLSNLRFRTRLLTGFGTVFLFTIIIIGISINGIKNIRHDVDMIYKHPFVVSNSVRDINININAIHRTMKDVVLAENCQQVDSAIERIKIYDEKVHESFDIVFESFLGDQEIVKNAHNAFVNWETIRNEVIALKRDSKDFEAAQITMNKGAKQVQLLFEKTKVMIDFAQNKADEFLFKTKTIEDESIRKIIITTILLFLISIIIAIIVLDSITKPIKHFVIEVSELYRSEIKKPFKNFNEEKLLKNVASELSITYQNLKLQIEEGQKSKQKIFQQYNEIQQINKELKSLNEELEKRVEIRTNELEKAKEIAEENEEKFRAITNQITEGITVADTEGNYVLVNPAFCKMSGYSEEELLRMTVFDMKAKNQSHSSFYESKSNMEGIPIQVNLQKKDRTEYLTEIIGKNIKIDNKELVLGTIRDITERVKKEQELKETRDIIERSPVITFLWKNKDEWPVEFVSKNVEKLFGYSAEEFISGKIFYSKLIHPDDVQIITNEVSENSKEGVNSFSHSPYRIFDKSGEIKWIKDDTYIRRNSKDEITHYEGIIIDITDRILAENSLKESEKKLKTLINTVPDIICFKDGEGRWLIANDADLKLFQLEGVDYYGKKDSELAKYSPFYYDAFMGCEQTDETTWIAKGITRDIEVIPSPQGKDYIYDIIKVPIFNPDNTRNALVVFGRDITEIKQIEQQLTEAKEKAEESDKLKSSFLANMSHEIRTPMNAILGYIGLLKDPAKTYEQRSRYVNIMEKSSNQLMQLINDILDISKLDAGHVKILETTSSVNAIFDEIFVTFNSKLVAEQNNIKFQYFNALSNEESFIQTDVLRLKQVLSNLISNAIKFTSSGSINFGCKIIDKSMLEFFVKDTGISIPKEKQKIIFNRFGQAEITISRKFGGTGLGLAISESLISLLGGKIWMESTKGIGSTFYFTIPYKPVAKIKIKKEMSKQLDYSWPDKLILIVEDEVVSRDFLKDILMSTKVKTIEAESGKQAVDFCLKNQDINMVLMDIGLPGMDGLEATRKIKKIRSTLPVIAQSAYAQQEDKEKSYEAGCDEFISKPVNAKVLLNLIDKYF